MGHETETKGKGRPRSDETAPEELQYERYVMIGGYENPDQSLPSGEGDFLFETNDPGRVELMRRYMEKYFGKEISDFYNVAEYEPRKEMQIYFIYRSLYLFIPNS